MKALIITNLTKKFKVGHFSMISPLEELGYEVHWASNFSEFKDSLSNVPIKIHNIDFYRNPFNIKNINAYIQLNKLIKKEKYEIIHCNSPIGGLLGRICGKINKVNLIIYTAHGFHFYKGASLINNFLYKNIEKLLALFTDSIITINSEDYLNAKRFKTINRNLKVFFVKGMGIDLAENKKNFSRKDFSLENKYMTNNNYLILSVGELNKNKNHRVLIEALKNLKENIHLVICGEGNEKEFLIELSKKLNVEKRVHFLGFRNDVIDIMNISDLLVVSSYREGLSRVIMEGMSVGLPIVASKIRGNIDLVHDGINGYTFNPDDIEKLVESIDTLYNDSFLSNEISKNNIEASKEFDIRNIKKEMLDLYKESI